jgi:iron complex outermembrane receptor protein
MKNLAIRASASSGFRAPSLQELNYTHTATAFLPDANGVPQPVDNTTFPTNSTAARAIGIKELSEERSTSYGAGLTYQPILGLELTVDAYQIDVRDRIFRTNTFNATEVGHNYEEVIGAGSEAQFFVNGANVRSKGIELVGAYTTSLTGTSQITVSLASIFSKNEVTKRKIIDLDVDNLTDEELVDKYLNRQVMGQFETGTPRTKLIGSVSYRVGKISTMLRGTYFGKVTELSIEDDGAGNYWDQTFSAQTIYDLSVTYDLSPNLKLSIGGNNILDTYPDIMRVENRGFYLYSNNQQGSSGAYYYGRIMFNF